MKYIKQFLVYIILCLYCPVFLAFALYTMLCSVLSVWLGGPNYFLVWDEKPKKTVLSIKGVGPDQIVTADQINKILNEHVNDIPR